MRLRNCVHPTRSILTLGIVIVLFFQCMSELLNPVNRPSGGIKWGLAVHTMTMFSLVTAGVGINAYIERNSFVDDRAYPGTDATPPGPLGYQLAIYTKAITLISGVIFILNSGLVDGLLVSSASNSLPGRLTCAALPALPMLCYLRHELLDNRLPMLNVPRFHWYVL